tara:strand:- start:67 stop:450 length:384 start_codon:yes stop_codon:yes gene_type:complete
MKEFNTFKQELTETIANSMGGGFAVNQAAETGNPNLAGYDPVMGFQTRDKDRKKKDKFAGVQVFKLNSEEYNNCIQGRMRYERWNKKLNMEDFNNQEIRKYAHKNPGQPIIVMDENTGVMSYLIPKK